MVRQTVRFEDDIHFRISSLAKKNDLSFNKFICLILKDYLNNVNEQTYLKEVNNKLVQIYDMIIYLSKNQKLHMKISKQHFANVGYLSNADITRDKCLNEILRSRDYFNE